MRNITHMTLEKYKYPPDKQVETLDAVMKQAEVLSDEWSR